MDSSVRPLRKDQPHVQGESPKLRKTEEIRTFIFLTVVMAPLLAVMTVGGFGFIVWVYQMFAGPPGSGLR